MPRIEWTGLPLALRDHLFDRVRERKVSIEDLYQLKLWRKSDPEAPDGAWYKDLARSRSAEKESIPRPFCCADRLPEEQKSSKRLRIRTEHRDRTLP